MSNLFPLEVDALIIDRLKKKMLPLDVPAAISEHLEPTLNDLVIQSSEPDPLPVIAVAMAATSDLQLDDSSTIQSDTSSLDDLCNTNLEEPSPRKEEEILKNGLTTDESARRLIEMQKMNDEDHRSAAYMVHSRTLRQLAMHAERVTEERARSEVEQKCMHSEDVLSRKLLYQVKKSPTKPANEISSARDALILKATNRMRDIRERRMRETMAKKILPIVHRRPVAKKEIKEITHDFVEDKKMSDAELARLERREKLIRRRELRLNSKVEEERRAAVLREELKDAEQKRQKQLQREARLCLEELMKKEESAKKNRLLKEMAELKRMEDDLKRDCGSRSPRLDANKENNANFCDLDHWTKKLSGV